MNSQNKIESEVKRMGAIAEERKDHLRKDTMPKLIDVISKAFDETGLRKISCSEAVYLLESTIEEVKHIPLSF